VTLVAKEYITYGTWCVTMNTNRCGKSTVETGDVSGV